MELTVRISKGREGWEAKTSIALDEPFILEINTYKSARGLVTTANRLKIEGNTMSFEMFGDFIETIIKSNKRCTEKTVKAQHVTALADVEGIKAKCAAFYEDNALMDRLSLIDSTCPATRL